MKSIKNTAAILNTLSYINLLPDDEQMIELRKMKY